MMSRNHRLHLLYFVGFGVFVLLFSWQWGAHVVQAYTNEVTNPASVLGSPVGGDVQISQEPVDSVQASIAYNSARNEYLVVWYNDRPGNDDIQAQRIDANGKPIGTSFFIAAGSGIDRRHPDVAYNTKANEYYVVWEQESPGSSRIHGRQVSATGQLLSFELDIASGPGLANRIRPAVAYSSTSDQYLVVWENQPQGGISNDIKGIGVDGGGYVNTSEVYIAQGTWGASFGRPDVAYNRRSNEFLVVYESLNKSITPSISDIYARIVRGNATPAPGDIPIVTIGKNMYNPAVSAIPTATAKGQYIVVWEWHEPGGNVDVDFSLWEGDGTPISGNVSLGNSTDNETLPAVAGNENTHRYLVLWTRDSSVLTFTAIEGIEVDVAGVQQGDAQVVGGLYATNAAVAAGGLGDFVVVFEDAPLFAPSVDVFDHLWGNRVYLPFIVKDKIP